MAAGAGSRSISVPTTAPSSPSPGPPASCSRSSAGQTPGDPCSSATTRSGSCCPSSPATLPSRSSNCSTASRTSWRTSPRPITTSQRPYAPSAPIGASTSRSSPASANAPRPTSSADYRVAGTTRTAQRGELRFHLPRGYVLNRTGEIVLDDDEQVQATIRLVFDLFERRRTLQGVLQSLAAQEIRLPCRVTSGLAKGELEWHRPNRATLSEMLHNPLYAGAYSYGRRPRPQRCRGGRATAEAPVLIKGWLPAYISWETYERNLAQMAANRAQWQGVVRGGSALLAGLVVCGRCGQRMVTQYPNNGSRKRYACTRLASDYGGPYCQSLSGTTLDAQLAELMLQTLTPAALEVSLQLAEDLELERTALHRQWQQRLERARYDVERAQRQYDAVEPENRLVVRTLEQRWEAALAEEVRVKAEHERFLAEQPVPLTRKERAAIEQLASDIPSLWHATTTTATDRQAIARLMLERVVVTVQGGSEAVRVECHWAGGTRTQHDLRRPVGCLTQLRDYPALLARVRDLHAEGHKAAVTAEMLNTERWRPPKRRATYNASMVLDLLHRIGVPVSPRR